MIYYKNLTDGNIIHAYDEVVATGEKIQLQEIDEEEYAEVDRINAFKVVIDFNDEVNPKPIKGGRVENFTSAVFPVVTGTQILDTMDRKGVTEVNVTYKDCSVVLYYNATNANIISLTQNVKYDVAAKDGYLTLKGTVSETNEYSGFKY